MQVALTRAVSRGLADCELTFVERSPIDVNVAQAQHDEYCRLLQRHGLTVLRLPAQHQLPDAVFVEDSVLVLDEVVIALVSGAVSRRPETESLLPVLEPLRKIEPMQLPGTVDGGDILVIGRTLFVGRSLRSNDEGIRQLTRIAGEYGYAVRPVSMQGCLHLKTGCTWIGDRVLLNPEFVDITTFGAYHPLMVPAREPQAADVLRLGDVILMPGSFPETAALLESEGYAVETVDLSEFQKAEAGVTCLSVIFSTDSLPPEVAGLRWPNGQV